MNNHLAGISKRRTTRSQYERGDYPVPSFLVWMVLIFLVASFARISLLISLKIGAIVLVVICGAMVFVRSWPWRPTHTAMACFLVLSTISVLFAQNYFDAYRVTLVYFSFIVVAFALTWIMANPGSARRLITVWVFTLAYVCVYSIVSGGHGPGGYVGDQNDSALIAAMALPFALFGLSSPNRKVKIVSMVLCAIFLAASVATLSRGGMIAMASVALFYFLSTSHKFKKLIVIAIALVGTLSFAPDEYIAEMQSITGEVKAQSQYSTGQIRLFMWATAINAFKDNPILGVGAGNFMRVVGKYQPTEGNWPSGFYRRDRTMQSAHSFYFKLLSEHGLVGIVIFGFLIVRFFGSLRRIAEEDIHADPRSAQVWGYLSPRLLALALMGSMIGFLSAGIFLSILTYPHIFYLMGMAAGLEIAVSNSSKRDSGDSGGPQAIAGTHPGQR